MQALALPHPSPPLCLSRDYKIFQIRNLRRMARFRSKLVAFQLSVINTSLYIHACLDKHTSLLGNP
jgi:hypothetical protein